MSQPGNTQCRSRRMTVSRIQPGGSCTSTASSRARSRTGRMVQVENRPIQSASSWRVAGPSFSTVPPVAGVVGEVVGGDVQEQRAS